MAEYSKDLLKAGFLNEEGKKLFASMGDEKKKEYMESISDKDAEKYVDEEEAEEANLQLGLQKDYSQYIRTGYPDPIKRYNLVIESQNISLEEVYFWIIQQLKVDQSFPTFYKLVDSFSASEQSSMWGGAQSRLKIQQDTVSQYLATIGNMLKNLFQLVRELRIIDERFELYDNWETSKSADVTLKGLYIDLVEGATKNPASVYGLAQNVGFTILPDLFFNTQVFDPQKVDQVIDGMKYNTQLKNVLRRKLYSYIAWKIKTHKELKDRRGFQIKYLRQHWTTMNMYMEWLKPYLRNIRRMHMNEKNIESVDIVSAFETSVTEVEFMAVKPSLTDKQPVILASFRYTTRPELSFQKDQYAHRGPVHVGRVELSLRGYGWSDKQIENYKEYKRQEGIKLFSDLDESVKAAMTALGGDLEKYLKEAEESDKKIKPEDKKEKKPKSWGMAEPFIAVFQGFGEIFDTLIPIGSLIPSKKPKSDKKEDKDVKEAIKVNLWLTYKNYKKAHGMITW
ncbi:MAG: hypothetical protein KJ583_04715 [Nanoarchaeota archaeon]|nr:hypothetical protein [Nanoarchaeota archaeon]MBU1270229.1 hypothetical protein [Nanoarchaeota archaeon]MBU1604593.1 hypothetical protein [Nanoarchaeota archaeon]MBU2443730.1 hypothetical protein [Nanoarchaeota archaeon]